MRLRLVAGVVAVAMLVIVLPLGVLRWLGAPEPSGAIQRADSAAQPAEATCAGRPTSTPRYLRGMWLTTVYNIDWPSRPGLDAETVRSEYRGWLDLAQQRNHNAIFVHVRPSGDAFWPSKFAPWSEWLTGKRDNQSPGWDPLEFAVAEAHARGLEFHAWFNPYRGSQPAPSGAGADLNQLAPGHPLREHPEWAVTYPASGAGSRLYFNPGIPEAQRFVEDSILDAVGRYDIDGVHFDDFFYPYPVAGQDFPDDATFAADPRGFAVKADWRRDNVNRFVATMHERIKRLKPWVKFGISPFGIWRNQANDPLGSPTRGLESYDAIAADTRHWVKRGWLDYIVPQLYWHIGFDIADYAKLLPWWTEVVRGTDVQLYVGQADYRVGQTGPWQDPGELDRQLTMNAQQHVQGSVHFSAKSVRSDALGSTSRYAAAHYGTVALVPTMPGLPVTRQAAPTLTAATRGAGGAVTLRWRPAGSAGRFLHVVYRVSGDSAILVASTRGTTWTDPAPGGERPTYCVASVDRSWNVGPPSAPQAA